MSGTAIEFHGLDNRLEVFFYEQDFYVLSNFSAFSIVLHGRRFATVEHAYHWFKFAGKENERMRNCIEHSASAHEAYTLAQEWKDRKCPEWDSIKLDVMRGLLRAKVEQHEYVRRKLLQTGDRRLVENSWRDDYWGWGPDRDGANMLGQLWMELRHELRTNPVKKREVSP